MAGFAARYASVKAVSSSRSSRDLDPEKLKGKWNCRTIKAGGPFAGFVVYGWFRCEVRERQGRFFFEKLSGSRSRKAERQVELPHHQGGWALRGLRRLWLVSLRGTRASRPFLLREALGLSIPKS